MATKAEAKKKFPGLALSSVGLAFLLIGLILIIAMYTATQTVIIPGTFTTTTVPGPITPGPFIIAAIGLLLACGGFARRLLAAVERR